LFGGAEAMNKKSIVISKHDINECDIVAKNECTKIEHANV